MRFRNIRNLALVVALMALVSLISFKLGEGRTVFDSSGNFDVSLMWQVKDMLKGSFLDKDKIDSQTMKYGAIKGMVAALGDPYTVYLPPEENKSTNEDLAGEFGGVGISLGYRDKTLAVMTPLAKTPADRAGIKAGDLILKITDKSKNIDRDTTDISLDEAVKLIRGEVGTKVILKMYREGKQSAFDVELTREKIEIPSVELEWKETGGKKVAWIKLYKFSETLFEEWPKLVDMINSGKADSYGGIVLDLRNNPGGYLDGSVLVASDFLSEGTIVTQKSSDGSEKVYSVDEDRRKLVDDKVVVLVNGGSASAAEILAGALKDNKRAKLIGEKTFGKGTVQESKNLRDGSGLHITIAKWLLPSGKNIHKEGVNPDVEIKSDDSTKDDVQLNKAIETLLN